MKCKACDIELEEGVTLCPACGVDNAQELPQEQPAEEVTEVEVAETAEAAAETMEEIRVSQSAAVRVLIVMLLSSALISASAETK